MVKEIILPKLGQTMEEGTIIEWFKDEGDPVERGEVLFALESDKATLDVEAPTKGFLRKIFVAAGKSVPVLTVVGLMTKARDEDLSAHAVEGGRSSGAESPTESTEEAGIESLEERGNWPGAPSERVFASPRARRRAREEGVEIHQVTGSGPNGRIVEQDVLDYLASQPTATPVAERLATVVP